MKANDIKALVIDDNVYKTNDICKALRECGVNDIVKVDNQEDAFDNIYKAAASEEPISLIVTDMHYPVKKDAEADTRSGFIFIERMKSENINIPIIICSSRNYETPDAVGIVWYSKLRDLREDFLEVLKSI